MVRRWLPMILLPALLAGCGLKHEPYQSDREIPEGPGMLSGKDGGLRYSGAPLGLRDEDEAERKAQEGGEAAPGGSADFSDYEEFRQYKEFQRWKETAQGSPEYREFQDWREWKEYRRWQRQRTE